MVLKCKIGTSWRAEGGKKRDIVLHDYIAKSLNVVSQEEKCSKAKNEDERMSETKKKNLEQKQAEMHDVRKEDIIRS